MFSFFRTMTLIKGQLDKMALDITALKDAVQKETTVEQSAKTLIAQLTAQIQTLVTAAAKAGTNSVDPAELQTIVDQLNANATNLSTAVVANTPTPSAPPPPSSPAAPPA